MADLSTQINLNPLAQPAAPQAPVPSALPVGTTPQEATALDAPVRVLDPYGRPGSIPASQLGMAKSQGYTEAGAPPPDEQPVYDAALAKGFSPTVARGLSLASPFLSWQQGVIGGATAGLGEGVERKIAGVVGPIAAKALGGPEMSQEEAEAYFKDLAQGGAHSTLHTAGEVAGLVGGTVAAPYLRGAGAAGAVGSGLGLLSKAGSGAAAGARGLLGGLAARGAIGRAVATGGEFAAQGALETGLYQGVHELSEEMFGKPEISAEKVLGAAADGAYGGAILGGSLGAAGSLGKSAVTGTRDMIQGVAAKNADALKGFADEQRWRALSPNKKFTAEAETRFPGGAKALGNLMGDEGLAGESFMQAAKEGDVATILGKTDEAIARVGAEIGESRAASTATVKWGDIDDAIEKVAAPLRKSELLSDKLAKVNEIRSQLAGDFLKGNEASELVQRGEMGLKEGVEAMRAHEIPLQDVVARRQILDDLFYSEVKTLDPKMRVQLMRELRSNLEDTIMKSFGEAAEASGDKFARATLEGLKRRYQGLSIIRDTARSSAAGATSNRAIGLTDYVTAAAFGGGLKGLIAGAGNKFLRSKGNAMAAAAADRLAAFGGKPRLTVQMSDRAATLDALSKEASVADGASVAAGTAPESISTPRQPMTFQGSLDDAAMSRLGLSPDAYSPDLEEVGRKVFGDRVPSPESWENMWHVPDGYSIKFKNFDGIKALKVEADILDNSGATVGNFERGFMRGKDGKLVVNHKYLVLDKAHQGKGIGSELQKSAIESYHDLGVDRIELHAGLDAGPYVWAKKGYQWQPGAEKDALDSVQLWADAKDASPEVVGAIRNAIHVNPKAVADLEIGGEKVGKSFLLDTGGWEGQMDVAGAHAEAAEAAAKAAEFERVHRAIAHVDHQVDASARGLVAGVDSSAPFKAARAAGKDVYRSPFETTRALTAQYMKARDDVNRMQQDVQHIPRTSGLPSMPNISTAMASNAARTAVYISSQLPQPIGSAALGEDMPQTVTDADMHSFLDKYQVATNPMAALRSFAKGRISPDQVDALKVIYPELFSQLQVAALKQVRDRQTSGKPLSFEVRQRMSNLLGVQTDPSQAPDMAKMLQANIASSQQSKVEGMGPKMKPGKSVSLPASLGATRYDRLESRKR